MTKTNPRSPRPKKHITSPTRPTKNSKDGWKSIGEWYDQCVGAEGHFYHREVILPKLREHLNLANVKSVLDLGCGQGILERVVSPSCRYVGIDAAANLIAIARKQATSKEHRFLQADLSEPHMWDEDSFDLAIFLLSLQNIPHAEHAIKTAAHHLAPRGRLALVLNHPCFRIPRQSEWIENQARHSLMRCLHGYLHPQTIPIQTHPGEKSKAHQESTSYHHSLSTIVQWLSAAGFKIEHLEEWISPKTSVGGKARMENRAREEFPLFLYIVASR